MSCVYLSNISETTYDSHCTNAFPSLCKIDSALILRVYGLCEDSILDGSYIIKDDLNTITLQGDKSTMIRYHEEDSQWKAFAKDGTLLASMNATRSSFLLGVHNWTIFNDILKCQLQFNKNPYTLPLSLNACSDGQFNCADGACIELANKCDGTPDCSDSSDEIQCFVIIQDPTYSKRIAPPTKDHATGFTTINIRLDIMEIIDVNEKKGHIKIKLNVTSEWFDSRMTFFNLKNDTRLNELETDEADYLWIPDILFKNIRSNEDKKQFGTTKTYIERNQMVDPQSQSKTALNRARKFLGQDSKIIYYEASRKYIKFKIYAALINVMNILIFKNS